MDLSVSAHKGDTCMTPITTNPAYEMVWLGGEREGRSNNMYQLHVRAETDPSIVEGTYEALCLPSHRPLPAIPLSVTPPTCEGVGVASEKEEESLYDVIRDQ